LPLPRWIRHGPEALGVSVIGRASHPLSAVILVNVTRLQRSTVRVLAVSIGVKSYTMELAHCSRSVIDTDVMILPAGAPGVALDGLHVSFSRSRVETGA